jgi:hypothetical protein
MMTRWRQMSLLQITLHFSCTVAAPHIGQIMADVSSTEGSADLWVTAAPDSELCDIS